jgi:LPS sulfotransferase NodH
VKLAQELKELRLEKLLGEQPWALVCDASFRELFISWGIDAAKLVAVEDIEANADLGVPQKIAVVCTEKPEGPVQNRLKDRKIQTLGLFNQLIPKLAAGLPPRYHPKADQAVKLEYAIMCLPRCGSTLVSRELRQAAAGNPVEHFRGYVQDLLREREVSRFDFQRWWDMVRTGHNIDGVFGTKIIYDFWKMAEKFMTPEEIEVIYGFLRSVPVIYIERADKFGQAVSDTLARQTGVWHIWSNSMKEKYAEKLEGLNGNLPEAVASYNKFRRSERELEKLLESVAGRVIKVDYEDLVASPKVTISRVIGELGLDLPADYMDAPLALEPTTSEAHQLLRERLREELR